MIFKLIFTDQRQKMKGFTFRSESHHDVELELEGFFKEYVTAKENTDNHRAVLYTLTMPNTGEDEEALLDNLTNPEYQEHFKTWIVSVVEPFENELVEYLEERSVFAELGL